MVEVLGDHSSFKDQGDRRGVDRVLDFRQERGVRVEVVDGVIRAG